MNVSFTECKIFREHVWGKQLLTRAGARKIKWAPLQEADTLCISLWKEWTSPSTFSIVFRASKKGAGKDGESTWELIDLRCKPLPVTKIHVAKGNNADTFFCTSGTTKGVRKARPRAFISQTRPRFRGSSGCGAKESSRESKDLV